MKANLRSAVRRLELEIEKRFPNVAKISTRDAIDLLDRSHVSVVDTDILRRLVPDIDLGDIFENAARLDVEDVKQVLGATRVPELDRELLEQAVRVAAIQPVTHPDRQPHAPPPPPAPEQDRALPPVPQAESSPAARAPRSLTPAAVHPIELEAEEIDNGRPLYRLDRTPAEGLVIHCGDPRFQKAFRRFITSELGLSNYIPVIIGGGLHAFGAQAIRPKNFKVLWQQIKFFIDQGDLTQIIFINHEDCAWYEKMRGFHPRADLPLLGRTDLRTAATRILSDFAGIDVRTYFAAIEGNEIVFEEVT